MISQSVTVSIHHPKIVKVSRLEHAELANGFHIDLGSRGYANGNVTIFTNDAEWDAIVAKVDAYRWTRDNAR